MNVLLDGVACRTDTTTDPSSRTVLTRVRRIQDNALVATVSEGRVYGLPQRYGVTREAIAAALGIREAA